MYTVCTKHALAIYLSSLLTHQVKFTPMGTILFKTILTFRNKKGTIQDSSAPDGSSEISIEKLETQLITLKTMFAEKQRLVADLEAYGAGGTDQIKNILN